MVFINFQDEVVVNQWCSDWATACERILHCERVYNVTPDSATFRSNMIYDLGGVIYTGPENRKLSFTGIETDAWNVEDLILAVKIGQKKKSELEIH